jgi:hypothetical protein
MAPAGRRLTLSPIGFDVILALSQAPEGLRLAELAHVIGSPVSSVQTSLRVLIANGLVRRESTEPPRYHVAADHPAHKALVGTATVIADAAHAIGIILRANPSVAYAAVDSAGFLVGEATQPPPAAREALDRHLRMIAEARPDGPQVVRMAIDELERLVRVALELRARARRAVTIKGRIAAAGATDRGPRAGRPPAARAC